MSLGAIDDDLCRVALLPNTDPVLIAVRVEFPGAITEQDAWSVETASYEITAAPLVLVECYCESIGEIHRASAGGRVEVPIPELEMPSLTREYDQTLRKDLDVQTADHQSRGATEEDRP